MNKNVLAVLWAFTALACRPPVENIPAPGLWRAQLEVMDGQVLPFNFRFDNSSDGPMMEVYNANEVIPVDEITIDGDSIIIRMPVFEGYLAGTFTNNSMSGKFIKESLDRVVPFHASKGKQPRFKTSVPPKVDVSGIWETEFSPGTGTNYPAKGIFTQVDNRVTGTFRTTTGDYRYLEGSVERDSLKLSTFDGAHAFLFTARVTDSSMQGMYYSGNHFKEPFRARRNESFELPDEDSLTYLKKGYDRLDFSFPNSQGTTISLSDDTYNNKVVIVQIMGTWCPNCLDETKFLTDYIENNTDPDLKVIALAFEYANTRQGAFNAITRLQQRISVPYPILLAQYGTSDKMEANEKLPMLNHVLSYPTTVYIDKTGKVRKIQTGFNGPATGEKYEEFQQQFESFTGKLLAE